MLEQEFANNERNMEEVPDSSESIAGSMARPEQIGGVTNNDQTVVVNVKNNPKLRRPQREFFSVVEKWACEEPMESREIGIVLPPGAGKTGCIAIAPFAVKARRTLIITPGLIISKQNSDGLNSETVDNFYRKCEILSENTLPKIIRVLSGTILTQKELEKADIIVTNIHALMSIGNGLSKFPPDFFDLLQFDEAHHNTAVSWLKVKNHFNIAKVINYSATPERVDGKIMYGKVKYTFPLIEAIAAGYVKNPIGEIIMPNKLEIQVNDESDSRIIENDHIQMLGRESAAFRKAVYTEDDTMESIVKASINALHKKRNETGEARLKIIAACQTLKDCEQVTAMYRKHGMRVNFVHCLCPQDHNSLVFIQINRHELDVIVHVNMLGEGYNNPFLIVAALFRSYNKLSSFYQLLGRVLRSLAEGEPNNPLNEAIVILHGATNNIERWYELEEIKNADNDYYQSLISKNTVKLSERDEIFRRPSDPDIYRILGQDTGLSETKILVSNTEKFAKMVEAYLADGMRKEQLQLIIEKASATKDGQPP